VTAQNAFRNAPRWQKALVIGLIVLGTALVIFFGLRAVHAVRRIHDRPPRPASVNVEEIREWMNLRYISRVYAAPPGYLCDELGIPCDGNERTSLVALNQTYFPDEPGKVLETVKTAVQTWLDEHKPPDAPPMGTSSTGTPQP